MNKRKAASAVIILSMVGLLGAQSQPAASPGSANTAAIRFRLSPIDFTLDSSETPQCHAPETMAGGVAVFDYNNDGRLDIFFANGADIETLEKTSPRYSNRLFENAGEGRFTDVTAKAGLAGQGYDNCAAVADYDNDGYADLFVGGVHRNTLYHNDGDGTFTDVTAKAGLDVTDKEFGPLWMVGGVWVDVNNDGLLDLVVINYLKWDVEHEPECRIEGHCEYCHPKMYKPTPNQLFLNRGDGTFKDASVESGLRAHPGKGMGGVTADFDLDGDMDLFVTNDKLFNFFFENEGDGKFVETAVEKNVALREDGVFISGMGADFRDLDNDGYPDICLVALDRETFPIYRNTGKGDFVEVTAQSRMTILSSPMAGYSPNIADFDNDGWKDIFVSRGHVQSLLFEHRTPVKQPNTVFRNLGGMKFEALTAEAGFEASPPARHRGAAVGDLNGDGRLDVVVCAIGAPAEIWINESPHAGHWLEVKLQGVKSNRDAIGARVKVVSKTGTQYDHMSSSAGYASSSARPIHFGLRTDTVVDQLEIRWPSGLVTQMRDVACDQILTVKEPEK
jgi:hypothetical protein